MTLLKYARFTTPLITPRKSTKLGVKARTKTQHVSLLQLNVWFAPLKDPESEFKAYRTKAALDHLSKCNPNVICLQEVTQPFWNALLNYSFFRDNFSFTDFPDHLRRTSTAHSPNTYGVLVAVRNSLLGPGSCAWEQDLPTHMGRRMVGVDVVSPHGGPPLRIGTCHFESLWQSLETRKAQFEICTSLISPDGGPSIFCGDTNITGVKEVAPLFDAGLKDAWNIMHPDVKLNSHVKGATYNITYPRGPKKRYDRIYFHPGNSPVALKVQHCEPVDGDSVPWRPPPPVRTPSDTLPPGTISLEAQDAYWESLSSLSLEAQLDSLDAVELEEPSPRPEPYGRGDQHWISDHLAVKSEFIWTAGSGC